MDKYKPKIVAEDVAEFEKTLKAVESLPYSIICQIERVEKTLVGLECTLKQTHSADSKIYLPNYTTKIVDFDDFIGIYSEPFFFKIKESLYNSKLEYIFIDADKIK